MCFGFQLLQFVYFHKSPYQLIYSYMVLFNFVYALIHVNILEMTYSLKQAKSCVLELNKFNRIIETKNTYVMYINCITENNPYIHQLHNTVVQRVAKNLHSHLLPDGAHIIFRTVEILPVCQQVFCQSHSVGTTVTAANHQLNNHQTVILL